jgi:hypothetical protein
MGMQHATVDKELKYKRQKVNKNLVNFIKQIQFFEDSLLSSGM